MTTFAISRVPPAAARLPPVTLAQSLAPYLGDRIEAAAANHDYLVRAVEYDEDVYVLHSMLEAVHAAFAGHYPLVLAPDDIWLCIAQGFGLHVEANAERLRSRFVRHDGTVKLAIRRDDFALGSPHNDWQGVLSELSDQIAAQIGKKRDLLVASFSTTGPIERAVSEVVLVSAMKSYFDARIVTLCGIPSITLLGTADDWRAIRRRAEVLSEFDLGSWIAALLPVLDQFVAAADGHADRSFWRSIYKIDSQSGGPYISGWINVLFPYLDYGHYPGFDGVPQPNRSITAWQPPAEAGVPTFPTSPDFPTLTTFPRGMSFAPFTWNYLGTDHLMMFCGGFCGVSQDARTNAVRPVIGWAIQHLPH